MSPKLALQKLFNTKNAIAAADLPANLETLTANLSLVSQLTVEALIHHHTLYRFYAAFLPQARSPLTLTIQLLACATGRIAPSPGNAINQGY